MPKQQTDYLINLIKSLTKAEKRHFKLFVSRNQSSEELLFIQLFDLIDKQKGYDEVLILHKIPGIKKQQLSNLKAHLYKQLLLSLRLLHRNQNPDIELRERVDYARVLYNKGLYRQSLEILDKTKQKARQCRKYTLCLEILDFEKHIEAQYITRSIDTRADELTKDAELLSRKVNGANQFSNLSLHLYSLYLKLGYVRNEKDYYFIREYFISNLPEHRIQELGFYEKLYLFQAYCWYFFMIHDFLHYYKYTQKWVNLFHKDEQMMRLETPLYLKGLHNLLTSLFMLWHYSRFMEVLNELEGFAANKKFHINTNVESVTYLYLYIHRINRHSIEGTFSEGLALVAPLMQIIRKNTYNWDEHRIMVFYYKIACMYFGSGDNENAIVYLNKIINQRNSNIREDIQCFARILCLIAHFELGNENLIEYQVKSVYRFLTKMEDLHQAQQEILKFLRRLPRVQPADLKMAFTRLHQKLERLRSAPYEKRPFLYLDIISWLESKIEGRSVQEVIHSKFREERKPLD
ncbi:MAG: hypothetical protein AAGG75_13810 [Bacteroidota bacterium]